MRRGLFLAVSLAFLGGVSHGATPFVFSVSPSSGPASGGTVVTLTGSNFSNPMAVTQGTAGGGGSATALSASSATYVTLGQSSGTVDLIVNTNFGVGHPTPPGDVFTFTATGSSLPVVAAVYPGFVPNTGGSAVTVSGMNFVLGIRFRSGAYPRLRRRSFHRLRSSRILR